MRQTLASKYDKLAHNFSESDYADAKSHMRRRLRPILNWGVPLKPGDSVFEIGCGDGLLAEMLVGCSLAYSGCDISSAMLEVTKGRLKKSFPNSVLNLEIADLNELSLNSPVDALIAFRCFFQCAKNPLEILKRLRPSIRKKIVLDFNPRDNSIQSVVQLLKEAGFTTVRWRPFLTPMKRNLPWVLKIMLIALEHVPILREIPLQWKFSCLIVGEV